MKYCKKCGITVSSSREYCPLCQQRMQTLPDTPTSPEPFPIIPIRYYKYRLFFQILGFSSIVIAVAAFIINFLFPTQIWWSLIVAAGLVYMWITVVTAVKKWDNIFKNILYQAVLSGIVVCIVDRWFDWKRWSVNYVIPAICLFSMLSILIISKVLSASEYDYVIYLLLNCLFCLIPLILVFCGIVSIPWPSMICSGGSIILISFILIFGKFNLFSELKRRLHL